MDTNYANPILELPSSELMQDVYLNGAPDTFTNYCKSVYDDQLKKLVKKNYDNEQFFKTSYWPFSQWLNVESGCTRLSRFNSNTELSEMVPEDIGRIVANMKLAELTSLHQDVVLIKAPTGSGKSIAAPILALAAYAKMTTTDSPGRFLHLTPTGVQANSLASLLHPYFKRKCNMIIGSVSGLPEKNQDQYDDVEPLPVHAFDKDKTHYCFATHFFGLLAFDAGTPDILIIDEVHEMSPEIVMMLYKAREALSLPKEVRKLQKVFLLSATVSVILKSMIANYFIDDHYKIPFTYVDTGRRQFPVSPIFYDGQNPVPNETSTADCDSSGFPNIKNMRNRASYMIANAIRNERNPYNFHHGVLAFVTGKADIELITNNLMKSLNDYNDVNKRPFTISSVTAKDRRDDIDLLNNLATSKTGHRITLSTSVLESGVTPLSTKYVIDTGTAKYMSMKNRFNVRCIITLWEDSSSLQQRGGRVGRMNNGEIHYTFSETRYRSILNTDHCQVRFNSRFTLAAFIGTHQIREELIIQPDVSLIEELKYEMLMNGYMDGDQIKSWVYLLGSGSIGLEVQLIDFVIASQGSGCELMALLYASAVETDLHFFSKHMYNQGKEYKLGEVPTNFKRRAPYGTPPPPYFKDGGLNKNSKWSREMPQGITLWLECINAKQHDENDLFSDFESTAEMLFNIMGHVYGQRFPCKPDLPKKFLDIVDMVDIEKIWRLQKCITTHLSSIGVKMEFKNLKRHYDEVDILDSNGLKIGSYFKLSPFVKNSFRALINRTFGTRMLIRRKRQYEQQFTYFAFPGTDNNNDHYHNKCEGEAQRQVKKYLDVAVYYSLTKYGEKDRVLRGQLHYQSLQEYVITGASINATEADFNDSKNHYTVNAITGQYVVQILNDELYYSIKNVRLHLAKLTAYNIYHEDYNKKVEFWAKLSIINYEIMNTSNSIIIEAVQKK